MLGADLFPQWWGVLEVVAWVLVLSVVRLLSESPTGAQEGSNMNGNERKDPAMNDMTWVDKVWMRLASKVSGSIRRNPVQYVFETIWAIGAGVLAARPVP